ncbi:CCA tRNA nucleotidyltransferase [Marivivens donghaensis]|uniref:CCA tRNA nucleotidyltransferase n=1 Tax=Marivivens donghaensis TaxID=1699413 RepID=UPI00201F52AA|nr:CCA tRNA nucleotidyltransferase [Marivivens donghaensis]MCL7409327.1 CCA tRNA nucleotidyltransferase [Marivivens donghaensis]MDN3702805.1 CCA tRNA nucleotidyltransferase [Marivivens donghaensis]
MRLTAEWLTHPASQAVCKALTDGGFQAYFVGGCVRNALLGKPVSDLDISTDARPEQTLKRAKQAGLKAIPTGIDHGTITVVADGIPFEITTFRRDVDTDGRHAVVDFADTMDEDARRRDFTMNALYAAPNGEVFDPVNGLPDLRAGHLRFIGDADQRIREDYLRILRFFRFSAWYGDPSLGIDADGLAACAENLDGLAQLSAERVGSEMRKLLSAADPAPAMAAMAASGVLYSVLPGAQAQSLAILVHLEGDRSPDPIRRLAVIGGEDVPERLRLSNADKRRLEAIQAGISMDLGELGYRCKDTAEDSYLVRQASMGQPIDPDELAILHHAMQQSFPVKAADLMPAFTGAALGERLRKLEADWIASRFTLSRDALISSAG